MGFFGLALICVQRLGHYPSKLNIGLCDWPTRVRRERESFGTPIFAWSSVDYRANTLPVYLTYDFGLIIYILSCSVSRVALKDTWLSTVGSVASERQWGKGFPLVREVASQKLRSCSHRHKFTTPCTIYRRSVCAGTTYPFFLADLVTQAI